MTLSRERKRRNEREKVLREEFKETGGDSRQAE